MNDRIVFACHAAQGLICAGQMYALACASGTCSLESDSVSLDAAAGDLLVMPQGLSFRLRSSKGFSGIIIGIDKPSFPAESPIKISVPEGSRILHVFRDVLEYYESQSPCAEAMLAAYGNLISVFINCYGNTCEQVSIAYIIRRKLSENISECDFDINGYFSTLPFSADYLSRLFSREFGLTPHRWLTEARLEHAEQLLSSAPGNNIGEIAHMCGFRDALYFSRLFRRKYGVSPKQLRD